MGGRAIICYSIKGNETLLFLKISVFKETVALKHANSLCNYPLHCMHTHTRMHMKTEIDLRDEL